MSFLRQLKRDLCLQVELNNNLSIGANNKKMNNNKLYLGLWSEDVTSFVMWVSTSSRNALKVAINMVKSQVASVALFFKYAESVAAEFWTSWTLDWVKSALHEETRGDESMENCEINRFIFFWWNVWKFLWFVYKKVKQFSWILKHFYMILVGGSFTKQLQLFDLFEFYRTAFSRVTRSLWSYCS